MIGAHVIFQGIECEITDIRHSNTFSGQAAWLKAIKGNPFARYSMGGPYQVNWCVLPLSVVAGIHASNLAEIPQVITE